MPYYNVTPHALYQSCMSSASGGDEPVMRARAWVEAENVYEVWKLVQQWFELIDTDEALNRYPDPNWDDTQHPGKVSLTQDVADTFIEEMHADFVLEKSRFRGRLSPEFARLPSHVRLAFTQEAYGIMKTSADINQEADRRLAAGEKLPLRGRSPTVG